MSTLLRFRLEVSSKLPAPAAVSFVPYKQIWKTDEEDGTRYKETVRANEHRLIINPIEFFQYNTEEQTAILKHELGHIVLAHHLRFDGKTEEMHRIINIVTDMEINGCFNNKYIKGLPDVSLFKDIFVEAYKDGYLNKTTLDNILDNSNVSAEFMLETLLDIRTKKS